MIQTMTNLGIQALATALASSFEIKFTHCAIGSGEFDPVETDARSMTALIAPVATVNVSIVRQEESGVAVIADVNNTILPGGTEIREMGIYATVNDGAEFLFSYAYTDEPEIVPPSAESTYERRFISHMLMSDEEAELTVTYDTLYDELTGAAAWRAEVTETLAGKADSADLAPVATSGSASDLTSGTLPADRIASLDVSKLDGVIDSSHLPSYVDDVLEFASLSEFPAEGESGKIYVALDTNKTHRWTGSTYVEISKGVELGETESTAHRGDHGAAAYAHAVTNKGAAYSSGLYKITTNSEGHVTAATAVTKSDILALGILPTGGDEGQALVKSSTADFDYAWGDVAIGITEEDVEFIKDFVEKQQLLGTLSWANSSWEDLATALAWHYAGEIDIHSYLKVGEVRTVSLSAMSATGVGESHVAQDVQLVLAEATNAYTIAGSSQKAAFIWNQVDFLSNGTSGEWGYMNSSNDNSTGWDGCARRTWCNNVYKAALPAGLQSLLKQVNVKTANKGQGAGSTKTSTDYCFLPAEAEIFGTNSYASSTYEGIAILPQWEYFKTAANRIKKAGSSGSAYSWWERSPRSSNATNFCAVSSDGTASYNAASTNRGLAPCGCI